MEGDHVLATYRIETPHSLERAAEVIAGEQSTGTFVSVPGETAEIKQRHGARVTRIDPLEAATAPSLPGSRMPLAAGRDPAAPAQFRRGNVTIEFPLHNFGPSLPNLLATVAGNLYELEELSGVRLVDLELPQAFADHYPGPAFGVEGTRRLAGVLDRPLIGTIVKPSIGLATADLARLVRELALAGIDFIKDDELHADPPYAPLAERVPAVMAEIERVADETGKRTMYAFNITGDLDHMLRAHDLVVEHGGTCVMASLNAVGFAGMEFLRRRCTLPIHGHRNFFGALSRHPFLGLGFTAYQKLWRLVGVDHLHVGGLGSKFYEDDGEVADSIIDCLTPMLGGYRVMPAISSAQWAGSAIDTFAATHTTDVIHLAGGGIIGHPDGTAAGVRSMRQGWEAALAGTPLETYAADHPELAAAIKKFGRFRS